MKLGTRPQGGESKQSADNFGHCYLPLDLAQGGELVEPFDIWYLEFLVTLADFPMKERRQKPTLGLAQSRILPRTAGSSMGPDSLFFRRLWAGEVKSCTNNNSTSHLDMSLEAGGAREWGEVA